MSAESESEFEIAWTPPSARRRRLVFQPADAGGFERIDYVATDDDDWRFVGSEIVSDVSVDGEAIE